MALGAKLKELRMAKKLSLQALADKVGASKAHIWELETGRSKNPSIELLTELAKALTVSVSVLIEETGPQANDEPQLVTMYRELKDLSPEDREAIQAVLDRFKNRGSKS
jgi:transcriptional regulator with XRE-family HTH domain